MSIFRTTLVSPQTLLLIKIVESLVNYFKSAESKTLTNLTELKAQLHDIATDIASKKGQLSGNAELNKKIEDILVKAKSVDDAIDDFAFKLSAFANVLESDIDKLES